MTQGLMIVLFLAAALDLLGAMVCAGLAVLYPIIAVTDGGSEAVAMWAMGGMFGAFAVGVACFAGCNLYAGWLVKRGEGFGAVTVANTSNLLIGVLGCNVLHIGLAIAGFVIQHNEEVRAELEGWADPL